MWLEPAELKNGVSTRTLSFSSILRSSHGSPPYFYTQSISCKLRTSNSLHGTAHYSHKLQHVDSIQLWQSSLSRDHHPTSQSFISVHQALHSGQSNPTCLTLQRPQTSLVQLAVPLQRRLTSLTPNAAQPPMSPGPSRSLLRQARMVCRPLVIVSQRHLMTLKVSHPLSCLSNVPIPFIRSVWIFYRLICGVYWFVLHSRA